MISQPKWGYVFVAVPKTGSTSIIHRLHRLGTTINYTYHQHANIQEYRQILGDELDNRFIFAFVRNPWDRLVSQFTMLCRGVYPDLPRSWRGDPAKFQEWALKTPLHSQLEWLTDTEGKIAVDFIGRFENFESDFLTVLETINGIHPLPARKLWTVPKKNVSNVNKHYSEYYNEETRDRVAEICKRDIDYFGYKYEKAPG